MVRYLLSYCACDDLLCWDARWIHREIVKQLLFTSWCVKGVTGQCHDRLRELGLSHVSCFWICLVKDELLDSFYEIWVGGDCILTRVDEHFFLQSVLVFLDDFNLAYCVTWRLHRKLDLTSVLSLMTCQLRNIALILVVESIFNVLLRLVTFKSRLDDSCGLSMWYWRLTFSNITMETFLRFSITCIIEIIICLLLFTYSSRHRLFLYYTFLWFSITRIIEIIICLLLFAYGSRHHLFLHYRLLFSFFEVWLNCLGYRLLIWIFEYWLNRFKKLIFHRLLICFFEWRFGSLLFYRWLLLCLLECWLCGWLALWGRDSRFLSLYWLRLSLLIH